MAWLLPRWQQLQVPLVWVNLAVLASPKQKRTSSALKNVQQLLKR
nr:MAG TPA: hypothetical protein [Caudoviricetes sp.]